jgi:hypothetical protein
MNNLWLKKNKNTTNMKKQIFTIIILLMGGVTAFGQFKFDGGVNSLRLQTNGLDRMYIAPNGISAPVLPGNVGIGTILPPAKLTVAGDLALQKIQRETGSGGYNDYDRQDASIAIFENGGTIGGIQGGSKGQMLYVLCGYGINQSALVIKHESAGNPTAANRILTHTGADFTITAGAGGVLLIYDDIKARWRIVETPSGSGTAGWGLTGNSGTNPATQFIGTTDAQPLVVKTNNVEAIRVLSTGNVGIGTTTPDAKLDVNGDFSLSKRVFNTGIVGTFHNLITQNSSVIKYFNSSNVTITGLAGGTDGKIIMLFASPTSTIILKHANTGSLSGNRIITVNSGDLTIPGGGSVTLMYDVDGSVWRIVAVVN